MFFDTVSELLKHKRDKQPYAVAPNSTVAHAVQLMNTHEIGAVLVTNEAGLVGILTERDVLRRVVEPGRDPASTQVNEVMTVKPKTVHANDRAARALECMTADGYRHVPVLGKGEVLGVLSMRDLNQWLTRELQQQADAALMAVKTMGLANRGR